MINSAFIHQYKDYDDMVQYITEGFAELDRITTEIVETDEAIQFSKMFNESTSDNEAVKKEASKTFLSKIGDIVLGLLQKIKDIILKCQKVIKEKIWDKKTDTQKLEKLMHEYPSLSDKIILAVNSGDLDIRDIKSMQDLTDGTIDLMNKLKLGKVDQTEFEKRFDKLYNSYKKYGKPLVEIVTGVGAVVGAALTLKKFKTEWLKTEADGQKLFSQKQERYAQTVTDIVQETANKAGQNSASVALRAWSKVQAENSKSMLGFVNLVNRISGGIESVVASSSSLSKGAASSVSKMSTNANEKLSGIQARKAREDAAEYNRAKMLAKAQAEGKNSVPMPKK